MRWYRDSKFKIYLYRWNDERYLLFNPLSGETHYLKQFAVDIISLIEVESLDLAELSERLLTLYEDFEFDAETTAYLQQTVVLLDNLGLIEPQRK